MRKAMNKKFEKKKSDPPYQAMTTNPLQQKFEHIHHFFYPILSLPASAELFLT